MNQADKNQALEQLSERLIEGFEKEFEAQVLQQILLSQGLDWLEQSTEYVLVSLRVVYEVRGKPGVIGYLDRLLKKSKP